jgi:hypothetical protein
MRINKNTLVLLISLSMLLSPTFMIPTVYSAEIQGTSVPKSSQMLSNPVRVAIYDDANTSIPSYTTAALLTNNHSNIQAVLLAAGYEVTLLTTNQIYNHELMTAKYDVFMMADHLPKTNISNFVKEYWLGGGALLSMDSAVNFLCYFGILPPESDGNDGSGVYWTYQTSSVQNITVRHPVSRSYAVSDTFTISNSQSSATFSWTALQGTSIASEVVKIATRPGLPNAATVVAFDPQSRGGKVVHLPSPREIEDDAILLDAIEWLCPRPKGRILFDLSHYPRLGVDNWDDFTLYPGYYGDWRNELVSRNYMFDKLYPASTGNFTLERLKDYDLIVVVLPDSDYSTSDINVIHNWVNDGGSLLIMGENPTSSYLDGNTRINLLLSNYDLEVNLTYSNTNTIDANANEHPTIEGCTYLTIGWRGAINISENAYALWEYGGNIHVACQDTGNGRIILVADMNWITDSEIGNQDNLQFSVNAINWLTASDAEILVFVQDHPNPDPNDHIYKGPVATALNELELSFYMTFTEEYLNLSLTDSSYKLVVIDNTYYTIMDTVGVTLLNFLKSGGYLIVDTWTYASISYNYLWSYLGFSFAGNTITASPPIVHIWSPTNPIFSTPVDYGAGTIESTLNFANTDYTNVTLYSNATAIAGLTLTPDVSGGAIILGVNGHAITNALHLTEYYDDTDDSTYPDGLEIWTNEIAYMYAQIHPETTTPGIPGYDMFIVLGSILLTMGLIAIVTIRKKRI